MKRVIVYLVSFLCLYLIYGMLTKSSVVPEAEVKKESIQLPVPVVPDKPVVPVVSVVKDKAVVPEKKKPVEVKEDAQEMHALPIKDTKDTGPLDIN
jgi:hypothetical protein